MDDTKILELCEDTYLVNGVIIQARDHGLFDASTEEGRAILVERARRYRIGKHPTRRYGALTVAAYRMLPDGRYLLADEPHASRLPETAKVVLRKEYPEHADKI